MSVSPLRLDIARERHELAQILALQQRNLRGTRDPETEARQGFVYAEHTLDLLAAMAAQLPQVIALDGAHLAGYSLAMSAPMRDFLPALAPMFEQFDRLQWRGQRLADLPYVVGGQVCVDMVYRGQGLIGRLYATLRAHLPSTVACCVTEIARRNAVSLRAHQRIGFAPIGEYRDAGEDWVVVLWDFAG